MPQHCVACCRIVVAAASRHAKQPQPLGSSAILVAMQVLHSGSTHMCLASLTQTASSSTSPPGTTSSSLLLLPLCRHCCQHLRLPTACQVRFCSACFSFQVSRLCPWSYIATVDFQVRLHRCHVGLDVTLITLDRLQQGDAAGHTRRSSTELEMQLLISCPLWLLAAICCTCTAMPRAVEMVSDSSATGPLKSTVANGANTATAGRH